MDKAIELHGYRNAYWVMSVLVSVVIFAALIKERIGQLEPEAVRIGTLNLVIHLLFMVAAVSGLVQSVTHIVYCRKGLV